MTDELFEIQNTEKIETKETKKPSDWTGNMRSTFVTLGASNHSEGDRETNDYYATEPKAMELLLEKKLLKMFGNPVVVKGI